MGNPLLRWLLGLWLGMAAICPLDAHTLQVSRLDADPPPGEVMSGAHDGALVDQQTDLIFHRGREPRWWRVRALDDIPASEHPQLVLRSAYLAEVDAWRPWANTPTRHALSGPDRDATQSLRALVVDLPRGLPQGASVWLRVDSKVSPHIPVTIESRGEVYAAGLAHAAWRSAILTTLFVLALLALAFWAGTSEHSYGWFAAYQASAALYLATMGGEIQHLPWLGDYFMRSPRPMWGMATLSIVCGNLFLRQYLDLPRQLPRADRILLATTAVLGVVAVGTVVVDSLWLPTLGNVGLTVSSLVILVSSVILVFRRQRAPRILLLSWLPMMVLSVLIGVELMGWQGPPWLDRAFTASFALAGLLLTIGLADKLLELRRDRDRASHQASTDSLTGMLTRPAIEAALASEIAAARTSGEPLSIAYVDVDRFKPINDLHGHAVGDHCLRIVALRVRARLRETDRLARYGGDEMLVILPATALDAALELAEQVRAAVAAQPLGVEGRRLDVTLSLGVAQWRPGEGVPELLERADAALYVSKSAGRNRVSAGTVPIEAA